jgi:fructosamine-3-kinase
MTFVKHQPGLPPAAYQHEAAGLAWLAEAENGCATVRVIDVGTDRLLLEFIETTAPSAAAARIFGTRLAHTHAAGAPSFGSWPPGVQAGYIAGLRLPDGEWPVFGPFYAHARIAPLLDEAQRDGSITAEQAEPIHALIESLADCDPSVCGPLEDPARLHGDLWSGNVLWRRRDAVLIDPSAHGGHRESDLAMLALFGVPFLDEIADAYQDVWPLAAGWQTRIPMHQVYPLLVHTILFGGSYGAAASAAARTARST